jgi:hypothetical protein
VKTFFICKLNEDLDWEVTDIVEHRDVKAARAAFRDSNRGEGDWRILADTSGIVKREVSTEIKWTTSFTGVTRTRKPRAKAEVAK